MTVHVLQLSDTHLRADGQAVHGVDPRERLATVLDAYCRLDTPLDLVVLTGDLTDDGSFMACRDLADMLEPLGAPVLAVPGNHDRPQTLRGVFAADSIDVGPWRIVGIDTSRPDQVHGTVEVMAEAGRLDRHDPRPTVLAMHHPLVSPSGHPWFQCDGGEGFAAELAARPHVKAVIAGHLHYPYELPSPGPRVFGCPSVLVGISHQGTEISVGGTELTGARTLVLGDDGSIVSDLLIA